MPNSSKTAKGSPVKRPTFEVKGAPFNDPGVQSEIREQIAAVCGGDQCLKFTAVDSSGKNRSDTSCPITTLPSGSGTVERGSVLRFTVTCDEGESGAEAGTRPQDGTGAEDESADQERTNGDETTDDEQSNGDEEDTTSDSESEPGDDS